MNPAFQRMLLASIAVASVAAVATVAAGCSGARLSHNEIRKQVSELGTSTLVPSAVAVRRIVSESDKLVIAETTVDLAVQFERDTKGSPWHISSVRLGDQSWSPVVELERALNEIRRQDTASALRKLDAGVASYRQRNNRAPAGSTIMALGEALHPTYMSDLVVNDAWGRPIEVETAGTALKFRSLGADGRRGTPDDVVFPE